MARILGIDFGTRRIGVAMSDETAVIAMPHSTIEADVAGGACAAITRIASEQKAARIVVGMPVNMDGTIGKSAEEVRAFAGRLNKLCGIPVEMWDERLTTGLVERMLIDSDESRSKRRGVRDKLAAQVILQSYLDRINNGPLQDNDVL